MDPVVIPLLVFWVIIASIVGGVILLRPVSRRLGHFLDEWVAIRRAELESSSGQPRELSARLAALEEGQYRLREQQEFMESLIDKEEPTTISSGD